MAQRMLASGIAALGRKPLDAARGERREEGLYPGRGQANAIGLLPSTFRVPPQTDTPCPPGDHRQRDESLVGKRLDVGPQRGEVVRIPDRDGRDALLPRLVAKQRRAWVCHRSGGSNT